MHSLLETVTVLMLLTGFTMLGTSRLGMYIRCAAVQGFLLGAFTVLINIHTLTVHVWVVALLGTVLRGIVFPLFFHRVLRDSSTRRELDPHVSYTLSILAGLGMLAFSVWLSHRVRIPETDLPPLVGPAALTLILMGLFLIVTRLKALTQVVGYLVMENGIAMFGVALVHETPVLVEMGILLDVFVAVFVMGIAVFHINREFDHIDTDRLSALKD